MIRLRRRDFCRLVAAGASAPLLGGCSAADVLNALVSHEGYRVRADLAYGGGPRRLLDLYVPERPAPAPLVVFFHGGAWREGDKDMYRFVGEAFAAEGFAVAVPNYRLLPEGRFPAFLEDGAAAVATLRREGAALGVDPDRLFLMGHSAGAYNAAMLALDPRWLGAHGIDSRRDLRGFVGLAGPYDFLPLDRTTAPVFGGTADLAATQPVNFVSGGEPPMLLATGLADRVVRPRNTLRLAELVRERGGRVELRTYEGVGHADLVAGLATPLRLLGVPARADAVAFLRELA